MCFTYLKLQPKQDKRAESKISYVITDLVEQKKAGFVGEINKKMYHTERVQAEEGRLKVFRSREKSTSDMQQ